MTFMDEGRYGNPFEALEHVGGEMVLGGASAEDLIIAAQELSQPVNSDRDTGNLRAFAEEFIANPKFIRREIPPELIDIDHRVADRIAIERAIGTTSITQAQEGES